VICWGFTAIFGKLISLPALPHGLVAHGDRVAALCWCRACGAACARCRAAARAYDGHRRAGRAALADVLGAIKLSNASVGATCIALGTVFVAMIEPWLARTRFSKRDLALGSLVAGRRLVVGGVPRACALGIASASLSALLVAIFGSLNKRWSNTATPLTVTALELGAGAVA
jgi:hypothetical protein